LVDLSPEQLERDRAAAEPYGYSIRLIEGDMEDLSVLPEASFDLVFQPVSAVYTPDLHRMYGEVNRVLRPGGYYRVAHWNPIYVQMPEIGEWDGEAYRIVHPQIMKGTPIPQTMWKIGEKEIPLTTLQFIHPLGDSIGGLCEAGLLVTGFREEMRGDLDAPPGSPAHVAAFVPPIFVVFARKT
jgi:SAM-dependent methyltransferase